MNEEPDCQACGDIGWEDISTGGLEPVPCSCEAGEYNRVWEEQQEMIRDIKAILPNHVHVNSDKDLIINWGKK